MQHVVLRCLIVCLSAHLVGCVPAPRFTIKPERETLTSGYAEEGMASYYADEFHGRQTSNGETYDMNQMTAAHKTLPFNTKVRVTNSETGKSVIVRINDRGPFKDNRIIDLSLAAAKELEMIGHGTARVRLEIIQLGDTTGIDQHYVR
ncbi:MAG: septal ring lytic transglycosylase RlpA family protein [Ignavibacteriae bacterium]|nr:septal ring lytic transglycosylase RlpA family protein [Ignavibacteria bacterium]MBI3364025.1 septal ring lytic transglycosylase RlpA family protein [Ignavibacteriota bacterium]